MDNYGYIGLDFETFSRVNLKVHGLDRYASDDSFTPLIAGVSIRDDTLPDIYDFVQNGKSEVDELLEYLFEASKDANSWIVAHNAGFERRVLKHLGVKRIKWLSNIVDSAVIARAQGAASHLEAAAPQLTLLSKLETGSDLIKKF